MQRALPAWSPGGTIEARNGRFRLEADIWIGQYVHLLAEAEAERVNFAVLCGAGSKSYEI